MKIRPVGADLFRGDGESEEMTDERRTDGRTESWTVGRTDIKKLTAAILNFVNATKTGLISGGFSFSEKQNLSLR